MNILITGANGQLGNEMRRVSKKSKNHYTFTDVAELDITDRDAVCKLVKDMHIDVLVNCAAYTNVDKAEDDAITADLLNHKSVENLAIACKEVNATLIHISTDYVFHGDKNIPYKEDDITNPLGVYGRTKLAGEEAIKRIGCKSLVFRTAWLYSIFGNNFVKTMKRLTAEKTSLKVIFDQVGTPTYAEDLAIVIYNVIEKNLLNKQGTYHFSNEGVCSWYDFAQEICDDCKNTCDIEPCHSEEFPSKVQRPHFSVLDKTKLKETFNIKILHWKISLKKCLNELNEQQI